MKHVCIDVCGGVFPLSPCTLGETVVTDGISLV